MRKDRFFLIFIWSAVIISADPVTICAQLDQGQSLRSTVAAGSFYYLASQIRHSPMLGGPQADVALCLLQAAMELDPDNPLYYLSMIELACRHAAGDYSSQVKDWLARYISPVASFNTCAAGIDYVMAHMDTARQKEQFLQWLLDNSGGRNALVDSYLLTQYGIILLERRNGPAAKALLLKAYQLDPSNRLAFTKLVELDPDAIGPAGYLEHLRLYMEKDPLDMDPAMAFSQYGEQLELYDLAARGYAYCAGLFSYLNPGKGLPAEIYLPYVLCLYQTQQFTQVIDIASRLRSEGVVDMFLESVAAKAAQKAGQSDLAERLLSEAEQLALHMASSPGADEAGSDRRIGPRHVAWFYCFVRPDKAKALDWANKAYAQEPNSPITAALLAYALVQNDQARLAGSLLEQATTTQIGQLAKALLLLAEPDKIKAAGALRSAIARDPASLVADVARQYLADLGQAYRSRSNPVAIMASLSERFGQTLNPRFTDPNRWIGFQVAVPTNTIRFGDQLVASVIISNQGLEPIVIGQGWLPGTLKVDVKVRGDIDRDWPSMISTEAFSYTRLLPGRVAKAQLLLTTGPVAELLEASPQASVRIEFVISLELGTRYKERVQIPPASIVISRPAVQLTSEGLRDLHQRITKAGLTEAMATSRLFVGLLKEQQAMAVGSVRYAFRFSDWLPGMLRQALIGNQGILTDAMPWELKVYTLAYLKGLDLDIEMAKAVGECLADTSWPVRLVAIYILAGQDSGFRPVLEWTSKFDLHPVVRQMASVLIWPVPRSGRDL